MVVGASAARAECDEDGGGGEVCEQQLAEREADLVPLVPKAGEPDAHMGELEGEAVGGGCGCGAHSCSKKPLTTRCHCMVKAATRKLRPTDEWPYLRRNVIR